MKVRIIENSWFAKKIVKKHITIYPFIFLMCSKQEAIEWHVLHHEWIHICQVRKLGWFRFYFDYIRQYFRHRLNNVDANTAYMRITYEIEAYKNETVIELPEVLE